MASSRLSNHTSTSANAISVGPNGATNPTLKVNASAGSGATGVEVVAAAAASGAVLRAISSGTNEPLLIEAKGSGTIDLGTTSTGAINLKRNTAVTGTLAASGNVAINTDKFTVAAASGNTLIAGTAAITGNVAVNTDKFTVAAASGNTLVAGTLDVTGAAALAGALAVTGNLALNTDKFTVAAASGNTAVAGTLAVTGASTLTGALAVASSIKSSHATSGLGYATGAGGAQTQGTSKATTVTSNTACGAITMHAAELAAGATVGFQLTNSAIAATDVVIVNIKSGGTNSSYRTQVAAVGAGSCRIELTNTTGGALSEAVVLNFAVIKAVAA